MTKEEYGKIVDGLNAKGPTPDLDTFRACLEYDANFYWRIPPWHVNNALDEALAEIERLKGEISEHVLRADSLRAEVRRLEEELELDGRYAVSEAVERIVEALDEAREDSFSRESLTSLDFWNRGQTKGLADAIALLRSRDWSKGEATHE
jgi:hypothetical protein